MQILLDLDGVIVDFCDGVFRALGDSPTDFRKWPHNQWDWFESLGWTYEQVNVICDSDFWADLNWTTDGHNILKTILQRQCPKQVYLVSCPMSNVDSISGKIRWVRRNLPAYELRTIITRVPKSFLATPDRLLIDDKNENVDDFKKAGGNAILYPRPWNRQWQIKNSLQQFQKEFECLMSS